MLGSAQPNAKRRLERGPKVMRRIFLTGQLYLWISWFVLFAIYLTTVYKQNTYPSAVGVFGLLLILYYAEGMEIAVATLADKQAEQISSVKAKKALQTIKRDTEWFFAQRQVFVVTIVTLMSLLTTFDTIYLPYYPDAWPITKDTLSWINLPFLFTLSFTTFTVLWWCQVFPKRLALRNSVTFLHQSSLLMRPIKVIGALNLPGPADQLVWLATKYTSFS